MSKIEQNQIGKEIEASETSFAKDYHTEDVQSTNTVKIIKFDDQCEKMIKVCQGTVIEFTTKMTEEILTKASENDKLIEKTWESLKYDSKNEISPLEKLKLEVLRLESEKTDGIMMNPVEYKLLKKYRKIFSERKLPKEKIVEQFCEEKKADADFVVGSKPRCNSEKIEVGKEIFIDQYDYLGENIRKKLFKEEESKLSEENVEIDEVTNRELSADDGYTFGQSHQQSEFTNESKKSEHTFGFGTSQPQFNRAESNKMVFEKGQVIEDCDDFYSENFDFNPQSQAREQESDSNIKISLGGMSEGDKTSSKNITQNREVSRLVNLLGLI
jgi:hypothetical protein